MLTPKTDKGMENMQWQYKINIVKPTNGSQNIQCGKDKVIDQYDLKRNEFFSNMNAIYFYFKSLQSTNMTLE